MVVGTAIDYIQYTDRRLFGGEVQIMVRKSWYADGWIYPSSSSASGSSASSLTLTGCDSGCPSSTRFRPEEMVPRRARWTFARGIVIGRRREANVSEMALV